MAGSRGAAAAAAAARLTAWRPAIARPQYAEVCRLPYRPVSGQIYIPSPAVQAPTNPSIHTQAPCRAQAATSVKRTAEREPLSTKPHEQQDSSSNPALSFPCLDALEAKSARLSTRSLSSGPEPSYTTGSHEEFKSTDLLLLDWGGVLPEFTIAYETWGTLNSDKSNAILLHTGLSASSHAHSTDANPKPGWWERFIGPGAPLDTNKYFVICTNVLGGCYGSTGPSSIDPSDGKRYATRFPILTLDDMVRAQFRLLDALGITTLAASVGASMGGMQSLAAGVLFPGRVRRIVSISGCARSHPYSIAMRHTQRQVLMMDPQWARGFYYDSIPPHSGMKLAREIATVTYRSGPEWEKRFGRKRADPSKQPALCPDFLIETYLDHAGEKFSLEYDANSLLYVSKAMDLFDLGRAQRLETAARRAETHRRVVREGRAVNEPSHSLTLPDEPYEEQQTTSTSTSTTTSTNTTAQSQSQQQQGPPTDLILGLSPLKNHPILVMGVASDILFPAWQQREIAEALEAAGSSRVEHVELGQDVSLFGHDTFLLDLENIGGRVGRFLE
ncbi:homoserine O-acetyltransferase [Blastomyces parvus]|uniref:Homoserine O-acetyltransferase n=1 Tax=Blastomyces parvus TaxID=2060905 RepID=A0A2B7XME1_9EURO|nr:homoserine O-acetyltransferase [Blastomyces parvus]